MTGESRLAEYLESLATARVLCVGDVMLDRFVYGEVSRVSPEAPIPVCRVESETAMLGGAGNVARNLSALGVTVDFVSVAGEDAARDEISGLLQSLSGVTPSLISDSTRTTTIKTRYVANGQQLLRADRERAEAVSGALADTLYARVEELLPQAGALVLSDYGKGVLTDETIARLIAVAAKANVSVFVDPKGHDYAIYRGAALATPNRRELEEATRMATGDEDAVVAAARHVIDSCGVGSMLVTRGPDGMSLVTPDDAAHLPAEAREVFDVSGAGDTVIAAMAACRAAGVPDLEAARLANTAAGIVVGRAGTAVATAEDVRAALRASDLHGGEGKIAARDAMLARVAAWRAAGLKIGFTNGVFDLLHPGHVTLLAKARAACDRLVVGLNSDASVQRLKGPDRPVQSEAARATVLGSLAGVDLVVIFTDDTPVSLIEAIKPDVLVKGADYTVDQVVGADIVQRHGGKVMLVDLEVGHSTTSTIARMAQS